MRTPERLIIVKADRGLIVTDDEGVSMRLALDGSKETGALNGVAFESMTKWEAGKLRVERRFKGGLKLVETTAVDGSSPPDGLGPDRRRPERNRPRNEPRLRAARGGRQVAAGGPINLAHGSTTRRKIRFQIGNRSFNGEPRARPGQGATFGAWGGGQGPPNGWQL